PAYRYSEAWGKRPPSFARARRAQLFGERASLIVAGTASIVGEETLHESDLAEQLSEIERNLEALVTAAGGSRGTGCSCFRDVRVYVPDSSDLSEVERGVERRFVGAERIEYFESGLCRPGLRVEIEGLAELRDS
ncbi:MAG: reactive intermediate/imine deaminase, partial [Acidobacteriota bacterium]